MQIKGEQTGNEFKVNGHRLKPYYEPYDDNEEEDVEAIAFEMQRQHDEG